MLTPPQSGGVSPLIQRFPDDRDQTPPVGTAATGNAQIAPADETTSPPKTAAAPLIAEDDAREVGTEQMRKSEFLDQMEREVCAAADQELAAAGRTAQGCPYIRNWLAFYRTRSSQHLERALRRYAPEAARASSARDYIPPVTERVRRAAATWAKTGKLTGVPEELASQFRGAGLLGALGGILSGAAGIVTGMFGGIGRAIGGIFSKSRDGGAGESADPEQIRAQLGAGQSFDAGVRSRMESAFRHDFSRVRVHTNTRAAELSTSLNARAFTIGSDIAFGAGEYQPGTPVGDALIAHELAHVLQQSGGRPAPALSEGDRAGHDGLEVEADESAVRAVSALWGNAILGVRHVTRHTMPRLKAGLKLQRCGGGPEAEPKSAFDRYLVEGTQKLKGVTFGVQWDDFCSQKPKEDGKRVEGFDTDYWVKQEDPEAGCKLVSTVEPAVAIEKLFDPDRKDRWHVDCGQFNQLANYYALLRVHGPDKFNKIIGPKIEFKRLGSTGLKRKALWGRMSKDEPMRQLEKPKAGGDLVPVPGTEPRTEQEVLDAAPFGSRVEFTHGLVNKIITAVNPSYVHENTTKVGKDAYVAHPFTKGISNRNIFTKDEIIDLINDNGTDAVYRAQGRSEIYISEVEFYDLKRG
ncbi:MAG TPA: DUF4157 domain-containing protein [Blastocatellia bacterium]|nr:DUF4157 domain-containing protein [Blastocatellia bacterium]